MEEKAFNFGNRVKELLTERNISQQKFLADIGIQQQRYYDWCNKGAVPNVILAMRIAEYFGMTTEQFVTGKNKSVLEQITADMQSRLNQIRMIVG